MLTDKAISQAKPKEKPYRIYDEHGLYLEVSPAGGKLWRLKYRHQGKEKRLSLGQYPSVSLKEAREKAFEARKLIAQKIDPSQKRRVDDKRDESFFSVAQAWWNKFMKPRDGTYPGEVWRRLEREVFPFFGNAPITEVDAPAILSVLRRIEERGTIETAHKIRGNISEVFKYAIACGLVYSNPSRDLAGAIARKKSKPMAAIVDPKEVGPLMRAIDGYQGRGVVRFALKMAALTFLRPGELRQGVWAEIDTDRAEWRIPADRMKMKRPHIVPLSTQALSILRELHLFSGHSPYLFPSIRTLSRPMSDMTVNAALRALGYGSEKMTGHGFRAMAASLLSEKGWSVEVIERQLAHVERSKIRAAYHRSELLEERKRMMQDWADYLDELRESG